MRRLTLVCAWLLCCTAAAAQDIVFASRNQARVILSSSDAYSQAMSDFDRAARLATARTVTEKEFLEFAGSAALEWDEEEKGAVRAALEELLPALARLALPLPPRVFMVKTSGAEDAGAAYTRRNAVILSAQGAKTRGDALRRLLAHELFHVSTRVNPQLADALYAVIGFQRCGPVALPDALASRRITNPDAPKDEHCILVVAEGQKVWALPVLVSALSREELATQGSFLRHVFPLLLLVERAGPGAPAKPLDGNAGARVAKIEDVAGFFDQVGRNTRYIIHPEEIVADNFMLLATGDGKVQSPEILAGIERVLAQYRGTQK